MKLALIGRFDDKDAKNGKFNKQMEFRKKSNMENVHLNTVSVFRILSASFLIAGTCIGGGMLALPIANSLIGFFPALLIMCICCIFMTITGLFYLEATLWMKDNAHLNTLSTNLLGPFWKAICWVTYLFICYASLVAYLSGGGKEINFILREVFHFSSRDSYGMILFATPFLGFLLLGHKILEKANAILFFSMIFAYILLICSYSKNVNSSLLMRSDWNSHLLFSFPLMLTTFSFPGIVPTIVPYLNKDPRSTKLAILIGTGITFVVYILWLIIIFGSVPYEGEHGLKAAFFCDIPATECLHYALKNPLASAIAQFFAFFALATSFLGISLSLFDFLRDSIPANMNLKKILFCFIVFGPSFLLAVKFERTFLTALELSGGIGDAILSGVIPVIMIWRGRYYLKMHGNYKVAGGKPLLISILLISIFIFICEIYRRF